MISKALSCIDFSGVPEWVTVWEAFKGFHSPVFVCRQPHQLLLEAAAGAAAEPRAPHRWWQCHLSGTTCEEEEQEGPTIPFIRSKAAPTRAKFSILGAALWTGGVR